jgi:hypothetical protein
VSHEIPDPQERKITAFCANCLYARAPDPSDEDIPEPGDLMCCRRAPNGFGWAFVSPEDWCGEHKRDPQAASKSRNRVVDFETLADILKDVRMPTDAHIRKDWHAFVVEIDSLRQIPHENVIYATWDKGNVRYTLTPGGWVILQWSDGRKSFGIVVDPRRRS